MTLNYKVTAGGRLGTPKVLTQASPNLDFTLAAGTTCVDEVVAGTSCTVEVTFAPRYPGARPGAVVITDESGNALATTTMLGWGVGPQIGFSPGTLVTLPYTFSGQISPVLDGANDIFVAGIKEDEKSSADGKIFLEELPVGGGAPISIAVTTGDDIGEGEVSESLAIDSVGDLFFTDGDGTYGMGIGEIPAGGGAQISLLPTGVNPSVDAAGNLYAFSYLSSSSDYTTVEVPFGCEKVDCAKTLPNWPDGSVVDVYGNAFYTVVSSDEATYGIGQLFQVPASGGTPVLLASGLQGYPEVIGVDFLENLYLATDNGLVERLSGSNTLLSVNGYTYSNGFKVNGAGDIYYGAFAGDAFQETQRSLPPSLNFGTIALGGTTPVLPLTIANTGQGTLTVSPSFSSPNFQIASMSPSNCLAGIILAQPCTLEVEFSPIKAGTHNDSLTLETNALENATVTLAGTAGEVATPLIRATSDNTSSGAFADSQLVTIVDATPGTTIYYTTDGTIPTASSTPYAGNFAVDATARITAIAIVSGISSKLASVVYVILPFNTFNWDNSLDYPDFRGIGNVAQLNGSAAQDGSSVQLTNAPAEAGSVFIDVSQLPIQAFTTFFRFQVTPSPKTDLLSMAGGFTFTIQKDGASALGGSGQGLGYEGIGKSVAVKFDLDTSGDDGRDSVGLYTDGIVPSTPSVSLAGTGIDLHSGDVIDAEIGYDGVTLGLTLTDIDNQATWSHAFPIDIPSVVGSNYAYVGFTGGTGAEAANQRLLDWTYVPVAPGSSAPPLLAPALPTYPAGMLITGLTDNGKAAPFQTSLELTDGGNFEAGSAFYSEPVNVEAFTTDFTFQFAPSPTSGFVYMADGMTFTIQNAGVNALGSPASALGYRGIGKSVAIKFDLHDNAGEGQDSTGLYVNGALPTIPSIDLTGTGINLHSGDPFQANLTYDGANLNMTLTDTVTSARWTHSFAIDIPATVGASTAYVGFTGSTGAATTIPLILDWTFSNP